MAQVEAKIRTEMTHQTNQPEGTPAPEPAQKDPRSCRPCFAANIAKLTDTEEICAIEVLAKLAEARRPSGTAFVRLALDAAGFPTPHAGRTLDFVNGLVRNGWKLLMGERLKAGDITVDADGTLQLVAKARIDGHEYWVLGSAPEPDRRRSGLFEISFAVRHPGA